MQMVIQSAGMTVLEEKSFDRLLATNSLRTQGQWVVTLCGVTVECTWAAGAVRLACEVPHATIQDKALLL